MPRVKRFDEEEVLQKAMTIFWRKGYYDTSIQDLVDFLEISRSSLYETFGGKRKLFEAAFAQYRGMYNQGLTNFLEHQEDVREGFRSVFYKVIQDDCADTDCKGCFIANTTTEMLPADAEMQALISQHRVFIEEVFYNFLLKGRRLGQISEVKDLKAIAGLFYTFLTGIRVVGKTRPKAEELMATADTILSVLD